MEIERPTGEIDEYDKLNTLVDLDDPEIVDRTVKIHRERGWGILRCRMAAIVEHMSRWVNVDFPETQRRVLIHDRWRQSVQGIQRTSKV
jgi:acetolactate synthase regulatory subunit